MSSLGSGFAKAVGLKASFPRGAHREPDEERRMLCAQILRKNHLTSDFFQVRATRLIEASSRHYIADIHHGVLVRPSRRGPPKRANGQGRKPTIMTTLTVDAHR